MIHFIRYDPNASAIWCTDLPSFLPKATEAELPFPSKLTPNPTNQPTQTMQYWNTIK